MKLYLALAVLILAFAAFTDAQEEDTIKEKFVQFGTQLTELTKGLATKSKTAFEQFQASEFVTTSQSWFQQQLDKLKAKVGELSQ